MDTFFWGLSVKYSKVTHSINDFGRSNKRGTSHVQTKQFWVNNPLGMLDIDIRFQLLRQKKKEAWWKPRLWSTSRNGFLNIYPGLISFSLSVSAESRFYRGYRLLYLRKGSIIKINSFQDLSLWDVPTGFHGFLRCAPAGVGVTSVQFKLFCDVFAWQNIWQCLQPALYSGNIKSVWLTVIQSVW